MRIARDDVRLIKSMGFGFVKVLVNPAVFQSDAGLDASRVAYLDEVVAYAVAERLPIVVCVHPEADYKVAALGDLAAFERFLGFVRGLARHMAQRWSARYVALQLMTEPSGSSADPNAWNWWDALQQRLWRAVRAEAPRHLLILSGDCMGAVEGLDHITPVPDSRVLYSFTFYEPALFTQQGGPWLGGSMPYIKGLPYPSGPETTAVLPGLLAAAPEAWRADIRARVEQYAAERWTREKVVARLARAVVWRERYPGARLWCAEFGCYEAAPPADRVRYLADVRRYFDDHGIGWAYWSYNETFTAMGPGRTPFGPAASQKPDQAVLDALLPDRRRPTTDRKSAPHAQ